ncbi:MAG: helix-turn-helix transcriptional regulator [Chloroflexota bacterium]
MDLYKFKNLTQRELEIARLVSCEMSDRQIAQKLGVSERTVRYYIRSACDKFLVETRVGLAVSYIKLVRD